jgi:thymidine kinase
MALTARPYTQGKHTVISGGVGSDKLQRVEAHLNRLQGSGFMKNGNVLVIRHPRDDPEPENIGRHAAMVTESVDKICDLVTPGTERVILAGAGHYSKDLPELVDALVRSNRDVMSTVTNLGVDGRPYNIAPQVLALADDIILAKSLCYDDHCRNDQSNRSVEIDGTILPSCAHHYAYPGCPAPPADQLGRLKLRVGPTVSEKTVGFISDVLKEIRKGKKPLVWKLAADNYGVKGGGLYDQGEIISHSLDRVDALMFHHGQDISSYFSKTSRKNCFIDEIGLPEGMYDLFSAQIPKGYRFNGTMFIRAFNRTPFKQAPEILCLADEVEYNYGDCIDCYHPASESQRLLKMEDQWEPAPFDDSLVKLRRLETDETREEDYRPRCLQHLEIPYLPKNKFRLPQLAIKR